MVVMTDGVLLFDGECGFCTDVVRWAQRRLPACPPMRPWQGFDLAAADLTQHQVRREVRWVVPDGPGAGGARAIGTVLAGQPHLGWRIAGRFIGHPPGLWLATPVYRWVAGHRSLISRLARRARSRP